MNIDEVLRWLARADEDLTLVGGQSVALWEHLLGLPVLTETVAIDCLASRLANIASIPAKRSPRGFDQLRAALGVCRAYLAQLAVQDRLPEAIKITNRIFDLALTNPGKAGVFRPQHRPPRCAAGARGLRHIGLHTRELSPTDRAGEVAARTLCALPGGCRPVRW